MNRVVLLACAVLAFACGGREQPDLSKEILVHLPAGWRRGTLAVGDDGRRWTLAEKHEGGERVLTNGTPGPQFRGVVAPKIAPKTGRVGYWATNSTAEPWIVLLVVDDVVTETPYKEPGVLVFSPDGRRWATAGGMPETKPADGGEPQRGPTVVMVDGKEVGRYADTTTPSFSRDGTHVAWVAEEADGRYSVVVDGTVRRTFEKAAAKATPVVKVQKAGPSLNAMVECRYLADGSLLVLAPDRDGWTLRRDDTLLGVFPHVVTNAGGGVQMNFDADLSQAATICSTSVATADDAPVVAWWERLPGQYEQWRVMRDGKPVDDQICDGWPESQPPPTLSVDGKHVAYACRKGALDGVSTWVVADGTAMGPYAGVYGVAIADHGPTAAWGATMDAKTPGAAQQWSYFRDGRSYGRRYEEVWRPRVSPDAGHVAWEAAPQRDGFVGIDRTALARFDDIYWGPQFDGERAVAWVVRRGRRIARVTYRW